MTQASMTDRTQQETQDTLPPRPARRRRRRTRWSFTIGARGETACAFAERNHRLYGVVGGRQGRQQQDEIEKGIAAGEGACPDTDLRCGNSIHAGLIIHDPPPARLAGAGG